MSVLHHEQRISIETALNRAVEEVHENLKIGGDADKAAAASQVVANLTHTLIEDNNHTRGC